MEWGDVEIVAKAGAPPVGVPDARARLIGTEPKPQPTGRGARDGAVASEEADDGAVGQFCAVTGADGSTARAALAQSGGDLQRAIDFFFEYGAAALAPPPPPQHQKVSLVGVMGLPAPDPRAAAYKEATTLMMNAMGLQQEGRTRDALQLLRRCEPLCAVVGDPELTDTVQGFLQATLARQASEYGSPDTAAADGSLTPEKVRAQQIMKVSQLYMQAIELGTEQNREAEAIVLLHQCAARTGQHTFFLVTTRRGSIFAHRRICVISL